MEWCKFQKGTKNEEISSDIDFYSSLLNDEDSKELEKRFNKRSKKPFLDAFTKSIDGLMYEIDNNVSQKTSITYKKIAGHLTRNNIDKDQFPLVVARCNFSELDTFEDTIKNELKSSYGDEAVTIIKISARTTVKSVVDDAQVLKGGTHGVLFIEQAECLSEEYVNKLFWLLKWFKLFLPTIACVSSDISSFSSLCSLRTLKMFEPLTIDMISSKEIFDSLMTTLTTTKSTVLQFSGPILTKLRKQFFLIDASVIEAKNIIKFAMLNHNIEHPLWVTTDSTNFQELVAGYWEVVEGLCEQIGFPCKFLFHEVVQNERFLKKDSEDCDVNQKYESWKMNASNSKLNNFVEFLKGCRAASSQLTLIHDMEKAMEAMQEARAKPTNASSQAITTTELIDSSKKNTKTLNELKRENEAKLKATLEKNKEGLDARALLVDHIEKVLKALVRPFLRYGNSKYFVIRTKAIDGLYVNPYLHMERTLLQRNNTEPVAIAYRTLQERDNWKSTSIKEWYQRFVKELPKKEQTHANAAFFSSLGQLEAMGVVKAASDRQKGRVIVLHFPVMDN